MTADVVREEIRRTQQRLERFYPTELAATNHPRRRASLLEGQRQDEERLSKLVTELGSLIQE